MRHIRYPVGKIRCWHNWHVDTAWRLLLGEASEKVKGNNLGHLPIALVLSMSLAGIVHGSPIVAHPHLGQALQDQTCQPQCCS